MYFIDKLVRDNAYPTTVSLAEKFQEKYGVSVDPRTIAADIAAMKGTYRAPLSYDYQKKGYFYTNRDFRLPVLKDGGEGPLPVAAPELRPRSADLPEWQQRFIASLVNKVLPLPKGPKGTGKKATVLLNAPGAVEGNPVKEPLLSALENSTALDIGYLEAGKKKSSFLFRPLHLICTFWDGLVFGLAGHGTGERYRLLYPERITGAVPHKGPAVLPSYVHIQTTGNRDVEVVVAGERSDLLLVFALPLDGQGKNISPEYELVVRAEFFSQGVP
jgi:predicted DNA-binding transcriptional regulator YafY